MEKSDAEFLYTMYSDPEFMRYIAKPVDSVEKVRESIDRIHKNLYQKHGLGIWLATIKETGEPAGYCGYLIQELDGVTEYEIAYGFAAQFRGKGLATEAARAIREWGVREKSLSRIISIIDQDNLPSANVALRNEMILEKKTIFKEMPVNIYVWQAE
ncbi:GNAT family N-acetyltransferase [bacterium AH-315-F03]|nr:GNAT family N-acetyltransferase [bacterium AH-315-F03]